MKLTRDALRSFQLPLIALTLFGAAVIGGCSVGHEYAYGGRTYTMTQSNIDYHQKAIAGLDTGGLSDQQLAACSERSPAARYLHCRLPESVVDLDPLLTRLQATCSKLLNAAAGAPDPGGFTSAGKLLRSLGDGPICETARTIRDMLTLLRTEAERDIEGFLQGRYDEVFSDPSTDTRDKKKHLERVRSGLGLIAHENDIRSELQTSPPCVSGMEAILRKYATSDIRPDEDDAQFKRRKELLQEQLKTFTRAFQPADDVSREELLHGYKFAGRRLYDFPSTLYDGNERDHWVKLRREIDNQLEATDSSRGKCFDRFVLVVAQWLPRYDQMVAERRNAAVAKKAAAEADAQRMERQRTLARRFGPVVEECKAQWLGQSAKCTELPGLSDDERAQCQKACADGGMRGYKDALGNSQSSCARASSPPKCDLNKPAAAFVDDSQFKSDISACAKACRDDRRDAAEAARRSAASSTNRPSGISSSSGGCRQWSYPSNGACGMVFAGAKECRRQPSIDSMGNARARELCRPADLGPCSCP